MLHVKPLGFAERFLDTLFIPIMYLVSGTFYEQPQMTHCWNSHRITRSAVLFLQSKLMVRCRGRKNQKVLSHKGILFHLPIFGGWKKYVVLEPRETNITKYYIGWINNQVCGVSRIPLKGRVRLLAGPRTVKFFGIDPATGQQIPMRKVSQGVIGKRGMYCHTPLL